MSFFVTLHSSEGMRKCLAELVGTFALVFAGTGAIVVNDVSGGQITHVGIALTFGLVVMAMIYSVGDISGAHLNPAVTLGFWWSNRMPGRDVLPYLVSQTCGATAASLLLGSLFSHPTLGATRPAGSVWQSFVLELVLTGLLMFVILNVAINGKAMAGVAVGAVIALEAMFAGPICGASMNPARSFAPAVVSLAFEHLWVYLIAPPLGSAMAVFIYRYLRESNAQ
jgi:aquaporin Z